MRLPLLLLILILNFSFTTFAAIAPAWVRIRIQKDLIQFPQVRGTSQIFQLSEKLWLVRGAGLMFQSKQLPSDNLVLRKPNGRFDLIAVVDFNEYLAGVVANEMPVSWPIEALKAQAVVARSFALARIRERRDRSFHLDSDQGDQVFAFTNSAKPRQAVYGTDGVVLQMPSGRILKAFYHADCGGQTVPASEVWGARAFDSGVATDSWCGARKSNEWFYEISRNEFTQKLGMDAQTNEAPAIFPPGQKAQLLQIGEKIFSVQKLREIFGFSNIRSAVDKIEFGEQQIRIFGKGFGHGAGLCQWGTLAQARLGKNYVEILSHYYPNAKLAREIVKLTLNSRENSVSN